MTRKRRGAVSMFRKPAGAALATLLLTAAGAETFEVTLWANDDSVDTLPEVVSSSSHPCGAAAIVRLSAMPPYRRNEGALGTELIVETDADGREIGRWSVPLDYEPVAISGSEILLDLYRQRLWIGTDGSIRREGRSRRYPAMTTLECPAAVLTESAYAQCAAMSDLGDDRRRLIRYEAPCT
jgi:hypothetical protein